MHQNQSMSIFTMCSLFAQGYEAAQAGIPRTDNPYPETDPDVRKAWDEGWMDAPTEGCIALPESRLLDILRWLRPARRPVIEIGVNAELARLRTR